MNNYGMSYYFSLIYHDLVSFYRDRMIYNPVENDFEIYDYLYTFVLYRGTSTFFSPVSFCLENEKMNVAVYGLDYCFPFFISRYLSRNIFFYKFLL